MKKFILFILVGLLCACSNLLEDDFVLNPDAGQAEDSVYETRSGSGAYVIAGDPKMILGAQLNNPYKVENMRAAYKRLSTAAKALAPDFSVTVTHRYYKLPCSDTIALDNVMELAARYPNNMYTIGEANPKPPVRPQPPKDIRLRIALIRGYAQNPNNVNKNTWNINMDPNDARYYSPIYIDLVDRSNQRNDYYNGSSLYPDDDIRGMPVGDVVNIAMRCTSISYFEQKLREHIGHRYEMQIITEDMVKRYVEIYKRFL